MRDSSIFYRSFYEAIKELPKNNQAEVYTAIFEYALNFNEVELNGLSKTIFTLIKPQIDANNKRFINGKEPKSKRNRSETEAKPKQDISETEAKPKQDISETEAKPKQDISETEAKPKQDISETEANNNNNNNENVNVNENYIHCNKKFLFEKIKKFNQKQQVEIEELFQLYFLESVKKEHPKSSVQQQVIFDLMPNDFTFEELKKNINEAIAANYKTIFWKKSNFKNTNETPSNIFVMPTHVHR